MLEFRRKFQKSSISACFLPQLPSACRNFCRNYLQLVEIWMLEFRRKMIDVGVLFRAITVNMSKFWCSGISTKLHRFRRAFCRNYLRRVKILMLEFRRKFIDFSVLFAALTFGVSIFRGGILATVNSSCTCLHAKRRFSMILDTDLHLFLSDPLAVDCDFNA